MSRSINIEQQYYIYASFTMRINDEVLLKSNIGYNRVKVRKSCRITNFNSMTKPNQLLC